MRRFALSMITGLTIGCAAFAAGSAATAQDVTIHTAQGQATLPASPAKVVAYDIAAVDTLNALGVTLAGGPDKLYMPALKDLAVEPVGTLFEPDLEKLAAIAPDLIVVGGRSATQRDAVSQVAPAIDMTIGTDLVTDAKARIEAYGTLFDKSDEAAAMIATLDDKLDKLARASADKGTALVVMTNGPKIATFGAGSRFGWIFDATALMPALEQLAADGQHGNALSHEAIAEADPDWLFVLDRGVAVGAEGASAQATLQSPLVESTSAWTQGHVVYLPAAELYLGGGGYTALSSVIDAMTAALTK